MSGLDFMAIGAHPDDVEIMAGGTVIKLAGEFGYRGIVVDLTDGGAGTRGNSSIRAEESKAAAAVMGVPRETLSLPDSGLQNNFEQQKVVISAIRKHRPAIILTHYFQDDHPDHGAAGTLVKEACYKSGLKIYPELGEPFRPGRLFYFIGAVEPPVSFCVDISDQWALKQKALECYESQFAGERAKEFKGATDIATPEFMEFIETRGRYYGGRIKRKYAEPFVCNELPEVFDLAALGAKRFS